MDSLGEITMTIDRLRDKLNRLIYEKGNLLDAEILSASKMLDEVLNEYNIKLKGKHMLVTK